MKARKFDKDFRVFLGMVKYFGNSAFLFHMPTERRTSSVNTGVSSNVAMYVPFWALTRLTQVQ